MTKKELLARIKKERLNIGSDRYLSLGQGFEYCTNKGGKKIYAIGVTQIAKYGNWYFFYGMEEMYIPDDRCPSPAYKTFTEEVMGKTVSVKYHRGIIILDDEPFKSEDAAMNYLYETILKGPIPVSHNYWR